MTTIYNNLALKSRRRDLRRRQTPHEAVLWRYIRNRQVAGYKFIRQYSVAGYILDFYCQERKLGIELDGKQHATEESIVYDQTRTKIIESYGIRLLRFWNGSVEDNLDGIIKEIKAALESPGLK